MNKEKITRAGHPLEPATSGLTCLGSTNWAGLSSPTLAVSLFCQYLCSGAPVKSHETIYCPLARDHAQVTIQPEIREQAVEDAP